MIVVRVDGGLGNQMFQVAFGIQLAKRHGTDLRLDLATYASEPAHGYLLDKFCLSAPALTHSQRSLLPARYRSRDQKPGWLVSATQWLRGNSLHRVREKPFGFSEHYLRAGDNSYLVGYWQSLNFFRDCQAEVRQAFQLRNSISSGSQRMADQMRSAPSIALHIRRGDYLSNPQAAAIYRQVGLEYYRHCVFDQLQQHTGLVAYVFSNDLPWCQQHLALPCPTQFITSSCSAGAHEDLWLMTEAQALAMANSTFSWWGGWLSQRAERTVYTPRQWFHPGTLSDRHLPVEGWIRIDDAALTSGSSLNAQSEDGLKNHRDPSEPNVTASSAAADQAA